MKLGLASLLASAPVWAALVACGGGSSETPDAGPPDGPPGPAALEVDCPRTVAREITEITKSTNPVTYDYTPNPATVRKGQVVRYRLSDPHTAWSSTGLFRVGPGTGCVQFNQVGTYGFYCLPHGFQGSVTVTE